jgi:hypothetical protein
LATGRIGTNTVLTTRWSKAPAGGTTSLSGLDDNSVSLVYSVGYEQVYRNGVLLSRGNDYTATDGTTITLIDATITGDIIEVFANATIPLTDTYSQSVANGKFINNTLTTTTGDIIYASAANTPARLGIGSTDQVLKVSGGVPAWATPSSGGMTLLSTTTLSGATVTLSNISQDYVQLYLVVEGMTNATANGLFQIQVNAADTQQRVTINGNNTTVTTTADYQAKINSGIALSRTNAGNVFRCTFDNYTSTTNPKTFHLVGYYINTDSAFGMINSAGGGTASPFAAITSLVLSNAGGNLSAGTARLYGVK